MDTEDTYRKHPFEPITKTNGLSVNEVLDVAEVIDSFEITEDVKCVIEDKFSRLEAIRWRVERTGVPSTLHSQRFA